MEQPLSDHISARRMAARLVARHTRGRERVAGMAALALGLAMVAIALQAWYDARHLLVTGGGDAHFIQINKRVSIFNSLGLDPTFSEEEIAAIARQDGVVAVGPFVANRFRVQARHAQLGFATELFFEAVPDAFLDVHPPAFRWREGQREIPVILSRDYLALYNFGFAPSHGLPPISPGTIKRFRMDVYVQGNGRTEVFEGRIVGFSDRINSILVPMDFLEWANARFGEGGPSKGPARLLLQVRNPADPALLRWLDAQGYELGSGRVVGEEVALAVQLLLGFILLTGLLIFLLAAALLVRRLALLTARLRLHLRRLLEQGYAPALLQSVLAARFRTDLAIATTLALAFLVLGHYLFRVWLQGQGLDGLPPLQWWVVVVLILLVAGVWLAYGRVARREVSALARPGGN